VGFWLPFALTFALHLQDMDVMVRKSLHYLANKFQLAEGLHHQDWENMQKEDIWKACRAFTVSMEKLIDYNDLIKKSFL
jgi:hypothetical protein